MPGEGRKWDRDCLVTARELLRLPTRFMRDPVGIDIWNGTLGIASHRYRLWTDDEEADRVRRHHCTCHSEDPKAALKVLEKTPVTDNLTHDSHFWMMIRRCDECGQRYLSVFMELIDWNEGDDSQAWMYVPITEREAEYLRGLGRAVYEGDIRELHLRRRYLVESHPRGRGRSVFWASGEPFFLPHD